MWGVKRLHSDQRRKAVGAAGNAVEAGGDKGFGEGHGRQDGGEPAPQHSGENPMPVGWTQVHVSSGCVETAIISGHYDQNACIGFRLSSTSTDLSCTHSNELVREFQQLRTSRLED
jgi:hypothetical protein